jgi:peptidyl-dipeptidase Dcp
MTMAIDPHTNPLLQEWSTAYGLPPFQLLEAVHFEPALRAAMQEHREELAGIVRADERPSFDNTVAAFDRSGRRLANVSATFYTLAASATNPELQGIQRTMAGPLSAHYSAVYMDAALFARLEALHGQRAELGLTPEQQRLLERVHLDFVRAGARFAPELQRRYAEVMQELARLTTRFAQNVLHDESTWHLPLGGPDDVAGLPDSLVATARQAGAERGLDMPVITLARSSVVPFLTFSTRRDLREKLYRAWVGRGESPGEHDNRGVAQDILRLRNEQARLHGHSCYADYALTDTMAGTRGAVEKLLNEVWPRALAALEREEQALLDAIAASDEPAMEGPLQAWDWRYWAEKVRRQRYAIDDAEIKPYFELSRVAEAAFDCAHRLFGLSFNWRADIPVYHPDVKAYEVRDASGAVKGIFLQDNFARPNKRSGAWMNALRWQSRNAATPDGVQLPVILNNNNFARGASGQPTLLSLDDARTLFHEFGHGLHGLLSDVHYERLSGTQVLRDFVELPSQIFEHWIAEPEVLQRHARHYLTGEPIPAELVERLHAARRFNQGYETVRYTASAVVDMAVHSLPDAEPPADLCAFESGLLQAHGLPPAAGMNHRLVHFQHLFAGSGYAAGYYVYLWAEVLDADGYDAFAEAGSPFAPEVAERLRRCIYAAGNSVEPGVAYAEFRGRAPTVTPLLEKRGLLEPA